MNKLKNQYRQYFDDSYGFTKEAIFYSPKLNTCVFAFFAVPMPKMYDFDNNTKYHIVDMFTQEGLFYGQYDPDINNIDAIDLEFNNKIQELK
jgi:hypothetical protein